MQKKVLVIDDEKNVRLALRTRLSQLGCTVIEADGPGSGRELLAEHRHDLVLVILDLRLLKATEEEGEESGLEFLKERLVGAEACRDCKRMHFSPDVIVFTAWPSFPSCRAAFLAGVVDYIDKSSRNAWEDLEDRVRDTLDPAERRAARDWLEDHFGEAMEEHRGTIIALKGPKIVASAPTLAELRKVLADQGLRDEDCLLVDMSGE